MFQNVAYLNNSLFVMVDYSKPLVVTSCGHYKMQKKPKVTTHRPNGREDWQLLYFVSGKGRFYFEENVETVVTAGQMVLFRPNEMQEYVYYLNDKTDVYWVHFSGCDVATILEYYNLPMTGHVFYTGTLPEYSYLFEQIIQELQMCQARYEELITLMLRNIFLHISRRLLSTSQNNDNIEKEISQAIHYFRENYISPISIDEYAESRFMSTCWFIRSFKRIVGVTPMQYILSIRMINAQNLLEISDYNIGEIAERVGYDNPLYFSRLFKKHTGMSPTEYRKFKNKND